MIACISGFAFYTLFLAWVISMGTVWMVRR